LDHSKLSNLLLNIAIPIKFRINAFSLNSVEQSIPYLQALNLNPNISELILTENNIGHEGGLLIA
jgi:hypothetical protein